ncbi:MAG: VIT domain-containing protein [Polyangiales bacterium]
MSDEKLSGKCAEVEERLAEAIDGLFEGELAAHVESCDDCRDRIHDATWVVDEIRTLGCDHEPNADLEDRILAAIDARTAKKAPVSERLTAKAAEVSAPKLFDLSFLRRPRVGAALALAAAAAIGVIAIRGKDTRDPAEKTAAEPWRGKVSELAGNGLFLIEGNDTKPLKNGDSVAAGAHLRTDLRTRARIVLDDGTKLLLDRGADLTLDKTASRAAKVANGSVVLDVTTSDRHPASIAMPTGTLTSLGGKLALVAAGGNTPSASIALARGNASVVDGAGTKTALAIGDGATLDGKGTVVEAAGLASAFGWSEALEPKAQEIKDETAAVPGLGELRARVPGTTGDGDKRLRLTRQSVSVKIAGELARTEIDEQFTSDDPAVLEGIFRFPLPPDAQIERLALEVDGKMEEGAFVERDRGAAIWKGVLFKATPQAPRPQEEWVWVPGPWHDPALLEWKAGGRMELRIFPIPAKGSRRVVLAYTQRIAPSAGVRRYVYPLPHFGQNAPAIDDFSLDLQVQGHEPSKGVRVRGYEIEGGNDAIVKRVLSKKGFVPSGDLVVEFARKDEGATSMTYAYKPTAPLAGSDAAFVAISLAPKIPRLADAASGTHVLVVDSSRSMVGERFTRASQLAARVVEEMDPRDRFALLACDVACVPMSIVPDVPGAKSAEKIRTFLSSITPEGASDPVASVRTATTMSKGAHVVYFGDGTATLGARTPAAIEAGTRAAIGEGTLTAVAIGVDSDATSLDALARGGGGVVVPYVAGQGLGAAALDVIEASSGVMLRDPVLTLPQGLTEITPNRLGAIRAGSELVVMARSSSSEIAGDAKLEGTLAGKPWSMTIPIKATATSENGNAFVPRMWAAGTIADLERSVSPDKTRLVDLSKTFAVPSKQTSLIVLESPAMAAAFKVESKRAAPMWSGETVGHASIGRALVGDELDDVAMTTLGGLGADKAKSDVMGGYAGPAATATASPLPPPAAKPNFAAGGKKGVSMDELDPGFGGGGGGGWVRMRREWYRVPSFTTGPEADLESKITLARTASVASPDSRDKLAELFGLVSKRDSLDEARTVMSTWTLRDPLDLPATLRRSELAAREGDRVRALRVVMGALDVHPDDVALADGLAEVAMRAGDPKLACAAWSVHADLRPNDVDGVARRVGCLRSGGDSILASALLDAFDATKRPAIEARVATATPKMPTNAFGDLAIDATWSSPSNGAEGGDVDIALVDPKGVRYSWLSPAGVRSFDATTIGHESLAIPWAGGGTWAVEITRPTPSGAPIAGTVNVRVLGETRSWPFVLAGARTTVGRVKLDWASRLVPW